jgi:HK97 family phage portal protein
MAGLIDRILGRKATHEGRSWTVYKQTVDAMGASTATGTIVSPQAALGIAAVYACCRVLGESMAALPLQVFQKQADGSRVQLVDHPISRLISIRPNPRMTAFEWRECLMTHLNLRGNAYTRIKRDENGVPVELWPLHPDDVNILHRPGFGLVYRYTPGSSENVADFAAEDVLHFKGLSPNGLKGYDPLTLERETFGHYIEAQQYGAETLSNDATPTGVLKHPGELGKEARGRVAASWTAAHGRGQRGAIAILEEGLEYQAISITPENLQFIETLKLKRTDIAGIFRVPPHMIGDLDKATFSNIEHQDLGFAKHTLTPQCERLEQVIIDGMLTEVERKRGIYVEHNLNAIMRGDLKSRLEAYGQMWDRGAMTADEMRALENMNKLPNGMGETPFVPMNFVPADQAGQPRSASSSESVSFGSSDEPSDAPEDAPETDDGRQDGQPRERRREAREALWAARQGIQRGAVTVIEDASRRFVRRDVQNVRAAMKRTGSPRELIDWIEDYFEDTDYSVKQLTPAIRSLAESLGASIAAEIDQEWAYTPALRAWVEKYIEGMAVFHSRAAKVQLIKLIEEAETDALEDELNARLDEWEEGTSARTSRPFSIANHEAHRFGGAFAVTAFMGAGVSALVWRATGKSCPWCQQMDGTVVGIGQPFMTSDDEMEHEGDRFSPSKTVVHPPLHGGCDCVVSPE